MFDGFYLTFDPARRLTVGLIYKVRSSGLADFQSALCA